jgi:hypothetical protein
MWSAHSGVKIKIFPLHLDSRVDSVARAVMSFEKLSMSWAEE